MRILRSTVMVRVGGGWVALDEFLQKNDPCRGKFISDLFISSLFSEIFMSFRTVIYNYSFKLAFAGSPLNEMFSTT